MVHYGPKGPPYPAVMWSRLRIITNRKASDMGREVRMVPADWQHPKYPDDHWDVPRRGRYIPLYEGGFAEREREWMEGWQKWQEGLCRNYGDGPQWAPIDEKYRGLRYTDYDGERPSPDDYMPDWPAEQRTHLMMYEDTSEGTPKSPAFETPEELARWLADNNVSAFGYDTATYEQWLRVCKGGWAPSAVISNGVMQSGVAALGASASPIPGGYEPKANEPNNPSNREGV